LVDLINFAQCTVFACSASPYNYSVLCLFFLPAGFAPWSEWSATWRLQLRRLLWNPQRKHRKERGGENQSGRQGRRERKEQQVYDSWSFLALHIGQSYF